MNNRILNGELVTVLIKGMPFRAFVFDYHPSTDCYSVMLDYTNDVVIAESERVSLIHGMNIFDAVEELVVI